MGQNIQKENQKKQQKVCEKIHKAISITSPTKLIRRISSRSQSPSPSNPEIVRDINIKTKHSPSDELVRVKFAETAAQIEKPVFKTEAFGKRTHDFLGNKAPPPSETAETPILKLESKDYRFTDYINRAKLKIRAMTNLDDIMKTDASETENETADASASKESRKDHQFTEYIKRAKMKIRATSSLGSGNRNLDSFKYTKD